MCRVLRSLFAVALLATLGAAGAWALTPDDAMRLTQEGVDDQTIIAKICADAEAWDLTADDIVYLHNQNVSDDVVQALLDPAAAAGKFGFTLGDATSGRGTPTQDQSYSDGSSGSTAYVYSLGYYYGPLARSYYCDPFFYPYMYSSGFSFGFSYWPSYYASYYWPYSYGYYPYPYFWYPADSYYYGYGYCGAYYPKYYGSPPPGAGQYYGDVRYRDGAQHGPPAFGSNKPNAPEIRSRGSAGADLPGSLAAKDPSAYMRAGGGQRGNRGSVNGPGERTTQRSQLSTRDPVAYKGRGVTARGDEWRSARGTRVIYGGKPAQREVVQPRDPGRSFVRRGEGRVADQPRGSFTRREVRTGDPGRVFQRRQDSGSVERAPARQERGEVRTPERRAAPEAGREVVRQPARNESRGWGGSAPRPSAPAPANRGGGRMGGGQAPPAGGGVRGHR